MHAQLNYLSKTVTSSATHPRITCTYCFERNPGQERDIDALAQRILDQMKSDHPELSSYPYCGWCLDSQGNESRFRAKFSMEPARPSQFRSVLADFPELEISRPS